MKKLFTLLAMSMMTTLFFVSCDTDDDDYAAYNLEGAWVGDMGVVMNVNDGPYVTTYYATRSELYFAQDPYRYASGTGYQVDYFGEQSPWYHSSRNTYYIANHINWEVVNGIIRLYYVEDNAYAEISRYYLSDYDGWFEGVITYENGEWSNFSLRKTYSPNDWNNYYDWGYNDYYWGYAKKNAMITDDDGNPIAVKETQKKPVRGARKN
ncbi:MAG: hepatitis A virus cellular receptor 1 [Prevotella sp.]|nr:hepatitis A virus cellular receptor 1 [Prevotella sp.]